MVNAFMISGTGTVPFMKTDWQITEEGDGDIKFRRAIQCSRQDKSGKYGDTAFCMGACASKLFFGLSS